MNGCRKSYVKITDSTEYIICYIFRYGRGSRYVTHTIIIEASIVCTTTEQCENSVWDNPQSYDSKQCGIYLFLTSVVKIQTVVTIV